MTNIAVASLAHRRLHKGVFIGIAHDDTRLECINAHCWIIEPKLKKVLVQKRSYKDGCYGGMYDISLAGHVDEGETPYEAIVREAREEGGIDISSYINYKPMKILFSEKSAYNKEPFIHNQQAYVYVASLGMKTINSIKSADKNEVACFRLFNFDDFKKLIITRDARFAPHPMGYYRRVLGQIEQIFKAYEITS
jgi:8-oxo-dGTP pyrophosphatase MutT (NUDIX family)